jgi:peptidoglycan/xylan/chitin deacetylase (PgdA/CDA1 family)
VCLTFDFDAISLCIGSFAATSPTVISRGEFGVIGVERLLRLLNTVGIQGTFFVPGHTADTYPDSVRAIIAAGHEMGHHGYLHENPSALASEAEEREILERGLEALDRAVAIRPSGYRAPSWATSPHTVALMLDYGFRYDSSLMGNDFTPYWCRVDDVVRNDGPYSFGPEVDLVEMPVSWVLDDFEHFEYARFGSAINPGLSAPSKVEEIWRGEFDYMYREVPNGILIMTMHPEVIGRGHRLLMLERLLDHFGRHSGIRFATLEQVADEFRAVRPRQSVTDPSNSE